MTVLSVFLDEVGFFGYIAAFALKKAGRSRKRLFFYLYITVSVLTVFTSNDIIILTFTPFICYFAKSAKIDPVPYLFAEFIAANTWSMALIIGNPTNIYISSALSKELDDEVFKDMYESKDYETFADNLLNPLFEEEIAKREKVESPTVEELRLSLLEQLDNTVFLH